MGGWGGDRRLKNDKKDSGVGGGGGGGGKGWPSTAAGSLTVSSANQ